jgi:alpha-glucosidase
LPIPADHQVYAVDVQEADPASLLQKYRRLIRWRNEQPALRQGDLSLLNLSEERLLGFVRACDQQRLLCLFNLSPDTVYCDRAEIPPCDPTEEMGVSDRSYHDILELPPFGIFYANLR